LNHGAGAHRACPSSLCVASSHSLPLLFFALALAAPAQVHTPAHGKPAASASAGGAEHAAALAESGHCAEALPLLNRTAPHLTDGELQKRVGQRRRNFTDVSKSSGIANHLGKAWGVVATDVNNDGKTDLFVANDTMANFLFMNRGSGKFEEIGARSGVAYSELGRTRSGMGRGCNRCEPGWLDGSVRR
jgi:hypothetical protein